LQNAWHHPVKHIFFAQAQPYGKAMNSFNLFPELFFLQHQKTEKIFMNFIDTQMN